MLDAINSVFYKKDRGFTPLETIGRRQKAMVSLMGFTLVELLIVIIIISILAALGLPQFGKTKEHAIGKEAIANLKLIAAAEKIYRMELLAYYPRPAGTKDNIAGDCDTLGGINDCLRLSITEANWDYSVTSAGSPPSSFTAAGDRQGTGGYLDCQYTITHDDADGEPNPNASCP